MNKKEKELDLKYLKEQLKYDKDTGDFYWIERKRGRPTDRPAGTRDRYGYRFLAIDGIRYLEHRLAWFYSYGVWPKEYIDHINGKPSDNRLCNLREATHAENMRNTKARKISSSGIKGVYRSKWNGLWYVSVRKDGVLYEDGPFETPQEAYITHSKLSKKLFGEFHRQVAFLPQKAKFQVKENLSDSIKGTDD